MMREMDRVEAVLEGRDVFDDCESVIVLLLRGRSSTHKEVRNVCRVITDFDVLDYKIRELSLALGKIYLVI